mgnify:CR=1 FL=1
MAKKQVSPGVLALRKVVDDVHKDARSGMVFFQIPV